MFDPSSRNTGNNSPLAPAALLAGIIITVVGGLITAAIVGEGRFAPKPEVSSLAEPVTRNRVVPMDPNQAVSSSFGQLTFCTRKDFDIQDQECMTSTTLFTGVVEILYVSWKPPEAYKGKLFTRKWYIDGESFLERTTYDKYGYLETDQRTSLKPGRYWVELYIGDILVQEGGFIIQ